MASQCATCDCMYPCRQAYQSTYAAEQERRGFGTNTVKPKDVNEPEAADSQKNFLEKFCKNTLW